MSNMSAIFPQRGLIVSAQALEDEPLHGGDTMVKMAVAARMAGAIGIRANGVSDIRAIKQAVDLPIIGLFKKVIQGSDIFITPTLSEVKAVLAAGADIVAMDVTNREGRLQQAEELIAYVHGRGALAMADVSTYEEGIAAASIGADFIGTTMSGYTPYSPKLNGPDLELISRLAADLSVPLVAEGRIWSPEEAVATMAAGADYVVVGSAITRPQLIAARFANAISGNVGRETV